MNLILIASSCGGLVALDGIFRDLPALDACVVIVQHMPVLINDSVRERLGSLTAMRVALAEDGKALQSGAAFIAPSDVHLELVGNRRMRLVRGERVNYVCPAADVTFLSVQEPAPGSRLMGIILSGMGHDGAAGLAHLRRLGAVTLAQEEGSCAVYGMPRVAVESGCVERSLAPAQIRAAMIAWAG
ncbi:MAG: chemotaxis protein CheB [Spirochaetes bacterium]|nr:chemotaxis protein CheB [Spirochaetota bacterium]